jgi:hypothetical protein
MKADFSLSQASIQSYIVDSFTAYAASALAANSLIRSIAGGLVPLGGLKMYHEMGLGWGNTLLAFLSLLLGLAPVIFYKYGEIWRANPLPRRPSMNQVLLQFPYDDLDLHWEI